MKQPSNKWRPLTTNCCITENQTIFSNFSSSCKPSSSRDMSKDIVTIPSFHWLFFSDLNHSSSIKSNEDVITKSFGSNLYDFQLSELRAVTQNFSGNFLLGKGGFGSVYKGYLDGNFLRCGLKPQPVAVKVLNIEGLQGHQEWLAEVIFLGQLRHQNLVKLIGYCCEDEERLLVYEFMPTGSLENHLFRRTTTLSWTTRLKITIGAAKGLASLHGAENPIIFRDLKTSNILLDSDFTAKLSDFGLAKMGPEGSKSHVTTRVMGTFGYAAPEYISTGHLTTKSDVYSFGVILLEQLTGRRALDKKRPKTEQNLVYWSRPYLNSSKRLKCIMDPRLGGQYSVKGAKEMAFLALQCISLNPKDRPRMTTIVETLERLQQFKDMAVTRGHWPVSSQFGTNRSSNKVKIDLRVGANCRNLSAVVSNRKS